MRLRRIEPGVYETLTGNHRIERIDSLGEGWSTKHGQYVEVTTSVWVVTVPPNTPNGEWAEIYEADTKRQCAAWLEAQM